jgi:hypothetical protein
MGGLMICNAKLRTMISVLSFLSVFFGVNTMIWIIAGEPISYTILGIAGYIVISLFLGLYASLAEGTVYEGKKIVAKKIIISLISMGLLLLPGYRSWKEGGRSMIIVSLFLSMGFLSSYWHYRLFGEDCFIQESSRQLEEESSKVLEEELGDG